MRLSRNALAVAAAGRGAARRRVGLGALAGAVGCVTLMCVASSSWRNIGWHAGVFCALAALAPETRRHGAAYLVDVFVAVLACLIEGIAHSSLAGACTGVAASAAGWSLGRSALALSKLGAAATGAFPADSEAAAVSWFAALQRTPPERFDWEGLERWMRADPSHRDAYERVEAVWYADTPEATTLSPSPLRDLIGGLSRAAAVTKLGVWLAPTYANRALVFSVAVVLSAVAVYG